MKSKAIHNPYPPINDDLVEAAINKEFGKETVLDSYEVVDFTKKGDNYSSCVTSVKVKYLLKGEENKTTYVVKLNRGNLTDPTVIDIFRNLYLREPIVLDPISTAMNENLERIRQPAIRAPKCFASCDKEGMEVLLAEDLRPQGFVMFDKRKGMDLKHAMFVVEELGRFHASSIVYDEKLGREGTSLEELYPPFNDSYFTDPDSPGLETFCQMLSPQLQMSMDILNYFEKAPQVNKWWDAMKNFIANIMTRSRESVDDRFNVLLHGDCWNNNVLFKYDKNGEPIDLRLVDFQMTLRGSPCSDLQYFFNSSLLSEMRVKNKRRLMINYYLAFEKILLLNDIPVPFNFQDLEDEFVIRTPYGCVSGMMLLPTVLVNPEDALELDEFMEKEDPVILEKRKRFFEFAKSNPALKTRFLAMFYELTAAGMCERTKTIWNPYNLLTEELVEKALKKDVGSQASLLAFETLKFTNKGDNYASLVIAINVYYSENGSERKKKKYVVKLNPQRELGGMIEIFQDFYQREILFLTTISKEMNEQLEKINQPPLKVPTVYAFCDEHKKEVFIAENLKAEEFHMFDRRKGLDSVHCFLVLKELGKFHASSLLYEDHLKCPIREKFIDYFAEKWNNPENDGLKMIGQMLEGALDSALSLLTGLPKYEEVLKWLESLKGNMGEKFFVKFDPSKKKFNVLSHGDCWTNNILFKYDDTGNPIDVRLLDFQATSVSSVARDLNYFMYTSIDGNVRKDMKNQFLAEYYLSFSEVLLLANKPIPFTFEELKVEVKSLMSFGCVVGMSVLSFILLDSKDSFTFDNISSNDIEGGMSNILESFGEKMKKNEVVSQRYLAMFDDLLEANMVPKLSE